MKKKLLFLAPAAALGLGAVMTAGYSFALDKPVTDETSFRNCINEALDGDICELEYDLDIIATDPVYVDSGKHITVNLNGHDLRTNTGFIIENGGLSLIGEGRVMTTGGNFISDSLFRVNGSSDATAAGYSVLQIGKGLTIKTDEELQFDDDKGIIRINEGGHRYGAVVDIAGTIDAPNANIIYVNGDDTKVDNAPILNITEGATLKSSIGAIHSTAFAVYNIEKATIETNGNNSNAFFAEAGNFNIVNSSITANGEDAFVFVTNETTYNSDLNLSIDGGEYKAENGIFYQELNNNFDNAIDSIEIKDGTFTAETLFDVESHFLNSHHGFITGGTWGHKWDEMNDNNFVASGYLKDFDTSMGEDSNVMTVTMPSVENLPEDYTIDLSRRSVDTENLKFLLEKVGIQGIALNQYIEAYLYDDTGTQITELPDGSEGITLRINGFDGIPELQEGTTRKYYIISMHYKGEGEGPEILTTETTYDEETGEVIFPNLTKFSNFFIAYADTVAPAPTPEEEEAPATPATGYETTAKEAIEKAATGTASILATALAGLTVASFAGFKLFRKKH